MSEPRGLFEKWADVDWSVGVPLTAGPLFHGLVDTSPETTHFWKRIRTDGVLCVKRCEECRTHTHPRQVVCSECLSRRLAWVDTAGRGTVYTFSTIHHAVVDDLAPWVPYSLGIVMLDEQVPFFAKIEAPAGKSVSIGAAVEVRVKQVFGQRLPVFAVV